MSAKFQWCNCSVFEEKWRELLPHLNDEYSPIYYTQKDATTAYAYCYESELRANAALTKAHNTQVKIERGISDTEKKNLILAAMKDDKITDVFIYDKFGRRHIK